MNMTKQQKREMKSYKLDSKTHFIVYLRELITRTDKCLTKHKKYIDRLESYIVECNQNEKLIISYSDYEDFLSWLSSKEVYLFNVIGDNQKISMSYKKYRDMIDKKIKRNTLDFDVYQLTSVELTTLNRFNMLRNWSNHVPESLLHAELKLIRDGKALEHTINPIIVHYDNNCTLKLLEDLYEQSKNLFSGFRQMHQCMKKDYSRIIGNSVQVTRVYQIHLNVLTILKLARFLRKLMVYSQINEIS